MRDDEYVVGLDLGTTKVCAVVGRVEKSESASGGESLKILGLGQAASNGIKKGIVVNIEETVESIRKAVQDAELMAGVPIERAVVGVAGAHIKGFNSSGVVGIKGKEIQKEDLNRVIDAARAVAIPSDRTALHVLPQEFKIDDQDGIRNPLGMMGTRLEAKVHIVTAAQSAIQNIVRCCEKTGLSVTSLVLQPLASARAVLSRDESDLGVALVDIGGGTTDLAVFHNGCIVHSCIMPVGGQHITQDLAIGLRTPPFEAERIKKEHGFGLKSMVDPVETIEVPSVGGRPPRVVEKKIIGEIIEPRLEEIFQFINREIIASGCSELLAGGVVLTGGGTLLRGAVELAEFIFDLPVKLAYPTGVTGFYDRVASPVYSTGVGLLKWAAEDKQNFGRLPLAQTTTVLRMKKQMKDLFGNLFS
ncbi:MAG: cell division protein FtsA [Proteobacteria bacterium]|nr:cell division protein FtsA [Pseudomonadota bacterium]